MLIGSNIGSEFGPLPSAAPWSMEPPRPPLSAGGGPPPPPPTLPLSPTGKCLVFFFEKRKNLRETVRSFVTAS